MRECENGSGKKGNGKKPKYLHLEKEEKDEGVKDKWWIQENREPMKQEEKGKNKEDEEESEWKINIEGSWDDEPEEKEGMGGWKWIDSEDTEAHREPNINREKTEETEKDEKEEEKKGKEERCQGWIKWKHGQMWEDGDREEWWVCKWLETWLNMEKWKEGVDWEKAREKWDGKGNKENQGKEDKWRERPGKEEKGKREQGCRNQVMKNKQENIEKWIT